MHGLFVIQLAQGGPGSVAGIKLGDVFVMVRDEPLRPGEDDATTAQLQRYLGPLPAGEPAERVPVVLLRGRPVLPPATVAVAITAAVAEHAPPEDVRALIEMQPGAVRESPWGEDHSILHLAARLGHRGVVALLIRLGADVRLRDHNGQTPVHVAAANGHAGTMTALILSRATASDGRAAAEGHASEGLLAEVDAHQRTPLQLAWENGHEQVTSVT